MSFSSNKGLPKFVFGRIILNKFTRIPSPRTPVYYLPRPYMNIQHIYVVFGGDATEWRRGEAARFAVGK